MNASKITMKSFSANTNIDASLIHAVVRQIGGWDEFKERAFDVANHSADGRFSGFIYYYETEAFTKHNKALIMELAKEQASNLGEDVFTMIANFNCLKMEASAVATAIYNPFRREDRINVFKALARYTLKEVARAFVDFTEQQ